MKERKKEWKVQKGERKEKNKWRIRGINKKIGKGKKAKIFERKKERKQ